MNKLALTVLWAAAALLSAAGPAPAQWPPLTGPEERHLRLIAEEAVQAKLEGRPSREPTVAPRLQAVQGLVASIYVDGRLAGRSWKLRQPMPLAEGARVVTTWAMEEPKGGGEPLSLEELARAKVTVTALSDYTQVNNDAQVPPRTAVIVYNGFSEGLALPEDAPSGRPEELLDKACESAGLRPKAWLLPQTTIYTAAVGKK